MTLALALFFSCTAFKMSSWSWRALRSATCTSSVTGGACATGCPITGPVNGTIGTPAPGGNTEHGGCGGIHTGFGDRATGMALKLGAAAAASCPAAGCGGGATACAGPAAAAGSAAAAAVSCDGGEQVDSENAPSSSACRGPLRGPSSTRASCRAAKSSETAARALRRRLRASFPPPRCQYERADIAGRIGQGQGTQQLLLRTAGRGRGTQHVVVRDARQCSIANADMRHER